MRYTPTTTGSLRAARAKARGVVGLDIDAPEEWERYDWTPPFAERHAPAVVSAVASIVPSDLK